MISHFFLKNGTVALNREDASIVSISLVYILHFSVVQDINILISINLKCETHFHFLQYR